MISAIFDRRVSRWELCVDHSQTHDRQRHLDKRLMNDSQFEPFEPSSQWWPGEHRNFDLAARHSGGIDFCNDKWVHTDFAEKQEIIPTFPGRKPIAFVGLSRALVIL
jgi:hypothetical protein